MLINLLLGLPAMAVCFILQSFLLIVAIRYYRKRKDQIQDPSFWTSVKVINGVMLLMVIGNLCQVAIWGLLFRTIGEFPDFHSAFYHSAVNFSSLGYGDIVMSEKHQLLGPLETINGVLMIGVTTAALMGAFQDAMQKTMVARNQDKKD